MVRGWDRLALVVCGQPCAIVKINDCLFYRVGIGFQSDSQTIKAAVCCFEGSVVMSTGKVGQDGLSLYQFLDLFKRARVLRCILVRHFVCRSAWRAFPMIANDYFPHGLCRCVIHLS